MKIIHNSKAQRQQGVALMITVIIVLIGAATLASYLLVTENESSSVTRSQVWNNSMTLTEAGTEEALAFINVYEGNYSMITNWPQEAQQNGWTVDSSGTVFTMTRVLATNQGYYTVTINNTNPYSPAISSQGYAYTYYSAAESPFMLAAAGTSLSGNTTGTSLSRSVRVTTLYSTLFPDAIDAKGQIQLNGNSVTVDSFNSTNANYSDWNSSLGYGTYDPLPPKARSNGNVSTDSAIVDALNIGNAEIYGHVNTGPGGTVGIKNNGYVGPYSLTGPNPPGSGITSGWSNDTMNVTFPDVTLPTGATTWQSIPANNVITISGNYYVPSPGISLSGQQVLDIEAPYVIIYVGGNIQITGQAYINIGTNVVNVSMYVAGPTVNIQGNGVVNTTYHASAFSLYGLPSLTSLTLAGNGGYYGTVYAPEANLQFGGAGNAGIYVGAAVVSSVQFTGNANFHYDESLATIGPARGFVPTSWTEASAH